MINEKAPNGFTCLKAASEQGHVDAVKVIISADADVNMKDSCGATALMSVAAKSTVDRQHLDVVRVLIESKADLSLANPEGKTALQQATDPKMRSALGGQPHPPTASQPASERSRAERSTPKATPDQNEPVMRPKSPSPDDQEQCG